MILGEGKAESEARGRTYENVGLKQRQRSSPPLPKLTDREATSEDEDDVYYHIGETKVRKGEREGWFVLKSRAAKRHNGRFRERWYDLCI